MHSWLRWVPLVLGVAIGGCLGPTYQIPQTELARLARSGAKERGHRVRATQDLGFASEPPPAATTAPMSEDALVAIGVALHVAADISAPPPRPRRRGVRTSVRPGSIGPAGGDRADEDAGGDADGGGDGDGGDADADEDIDAVAAAVFVVAGAALGLGVAATEGMRFDGWVQLSEEQPLHLIGPAGEHAWLPLGALQPEVAAWARYGIVSETEGNVLRLDRAPLDRVGFAFEFDLGASWLNAPANDASDSDTTVGFGGRVAFGGFPWPELGALLGVGVGWADEALEWRPHLEVQFVPLQVGRLHGGLWAQGGWVFGTRTGPDNDFDGPYGGGGVLVQIDLTTRLALTLRGGAIVAPEPGTTDVLPEIMLGLAVY